MAEKYFINSVEGVESVRNEVLSLYRSYNNVGVPSRKNTENRSAMVTEKSRIPATFSRRTVGEM